jgi:hypothetical protein
VRPTTLSAEGAGTRPGAHLGLAGDWSWGGEVTGELAQRRTAAVVTASCDFSKGEVELGNAQRCELLWGPGESLGCLAGDGHERRGRLRSAAEMAGGGKLREVEGACTCWGNGRLHARCFEAIKRNEGVRPARRRCRRAGRTRPGAGRQGRDMGRRKLQGAQGARYLGGHRSRDVRPAGARTPIQGGAPRGALWRDSAVS